MHIFKLLAVYVHRHYLLAAYICTMRFLLVVLLAVLPAVIKAQQPAPKHNDSSLLRRSIQTKLLQQGWQAADIQSLVFSDFQPSRNGLPGHAWLLQQYRGLPVVLTHSGAHWDAKGELRGFHSAFRPLHRMYTVEFPSAPVIPSAACLIHHNTPLHLPYAAHDSCVYITKAWFPRHDSLFPALQVFAVDAQSLAWTETYVDARNGAILARTELQVSCQPPSDPEPAYRIAAYPLENLAQQAPQWLRNPADPDASPYGWHDTDARQGAEFTITRGNNAYAYEDRDGDNYPGFSPDGGPDLQFDFPYDPFFSVPHQFPAFGISQVFGSVNELHDRFWHLGFDEKAGNFQQNNYGRGGNGRDPVWVDALDGSGINNANMGVASEGNVSRMQLFTYRNDAANTWLEVTYPPEHRMRLPARMATFSYPDTGVLYGRRFRWADDGGWAQGKYGCSPYINASYMPGCWAVVRRNAQCTQAQQARMARRTGVVGLIILESSGNGTVLTTNEGTGLKIPVYSLGKDASDRFEMAMNTGAAEGFVRDSLVKGSRPDAGLDLGVVAHEYAHGVSIRLTCGPHTVGLGVLSASEQMGEGWSDYYALAFTQQAGDKAEKPRGVGAFISGKESGLRRYPYTTNMQLNPLTYGDVVNAVSTGRSGMHDIGTVWCSMLWDLHWKFIERYGMDIRCRDLRSGNMRCMQLVLEAMKLQPCNPGFADGRNAILLADSLLNGAVHADMIWEVFARRGLGADAIQGEANLLDDGVAGFKLPSQVMRAAETAGLEGFHIFPQPAGDWLELAFPRHAESFNLYLYDGTGRTLRSFSIPAGISARISLEGLKPGCYFLGTGNGAARRVLKF